MFEFTSVFLKINMDFYWDETFVSLFVMIGIRFGLLLGCFKLRLNVHVSKKETIKQAEGPCHSKCGTVKAL